MPMGYDIVKNIPDVKLMELHWQKQMTMEEIAQVIGYSHEQSGYFIAKAFDKRGLKRRTRSEAALLSRKIKPPIPVLRGEKHPMWRGGRIKHCGYIKVIMPEHPQAHLTGYVYEHRLVAEKQLGRPLKKMR